MKSENYSFSDVHTAIQAGILRFFGAISTGKKEKTYERTARILRRKATIGIDTTAIIGLFKGESAVKKVLQKIEEPIVCGISKIITRIIKHFEGKPGIKVIQYLE